MKGFWVTTLAVGGVILVLTLFLGLQYNWLSRASEAERERMQRRVETDTKNFADDLNREIHAAFFNFQTDDESWEKKDWSDFNEQYQYWKGNTQYPDLIKEFVFVPKPAGQILLYDPESRSFAPAVDIPAEVEAVRAKLSTNSASFFDGSSILIMPVHRKEEPRETVLLRFARPEETAAVHFRERRDPFALSESYGSLLIVLNRDTITGRLVPDLMAKHFPEGNFKLSIIGREQQPVYRSAGDLTGSDAKAGLLSLTPDNRLFFGSGGILRKMRTERDPGVVVNERIESRTFSRTETNSTGTRAGKFTIEVKPGPGSDVKTRTSIFTSGESDGDPWTLQVQHEAGSIDAFTRGEFNKSFAIGLGVYLLLVGAIAAILISALRSKRFAQRQIDFVSSVSHEFRTPIAVIYSASENLADGVAKDRDQVTRYGNLIKGEGRKLSAMVEQILQFAGARSGRKKYNFALVRPADVVRSAVNECAPIFEGKGFEIEITADESLPMVKADAEALSTALQNLISNSVKYSDNAKWMKVSASNGNGMIKLTVADKGMGVSREDLKHIFDPFYRTQNVVDAQIHGNGLGLALVKEIAEAHGGRVRAKSEAGKGSEFAIELPMAEPPS